jgi:putative hydrolase of the HAD superfamily
MDTAANPVVDWSRVRTVFLDMDGTLLDLHFDNYFWQEHLPLRYGEREGLDLAEAKRLLEPHFRRLAGSLQWYCLDYWSDLLDLDIVALKQEVQHLIQVLPDVHGFLHAVRASGRRQVLVTNAHTHSLALKMDHTDIGDHFDAIISSHEFGAPKEDAAFWDRLREVERFDPAASVMFDDSLPVLRAARAYGVGQVVAMRKPDTRQAVREITEFPAVESLAEILPGAGGG